MNTLEQFTLLEQKIESAVAKIQQLQAENDALRNKCKELTNALSDKSEQLSFFQNDKSRIETGIQKALDRLNSIENTVLKTDDQSIPYLQKQTVEAYSAPIIEQNDIPDQEVEETPTPSFEFSNQKAQNVYSSKISLRDSFDQEPVHSVPQFQQTEESVEPKIESEENPYLNPFNTATPDFGNQSFDSMSNLGTNSIDEPELDDEENQNGGDFGFDIF